MRRENMRREELLGSLGICIALTTYRNNINACKKYFKST